MKKVVFCICFLLLLFSSQGVMADGFTFELYQSENAMTLARITGYDGNIPSHLSIPNTVSDANGTYQVASVAGGSFANNQSITSVEIPTTIQETTPRYNDYGVFRGCSNLTTVTFRSGIQKIPRGLLGGITGLTTITIPDTVTSIEYKAFVDCTNLQTVNFSSNLTYIGDYAFENCTSLRSLNFPANLTEIGVGSFMNCTSLQTISFPDRLATIGGSAFGNCQSLTSVEIPANIQETTSRNNDYGVFRGCSNLTTVTFRSGIRKIPKGLFGGTTGLTTITIPDTVTSIEDVAFYECPNLRTITLPDSIWSIGSRAFGDCTSLTRIVIPEGVMEIKENTFQNCRSLTEVTLPESLTKIYKNAFVGCAITDIEIPQNVTSIGESAFMDCSSLSNVQMHIGLESIGQYAFRNCDSLESITLPNSVTSLGKYALADCDLLSSVTLSQGLTQITEGLLSNDISLEEILLPYRVTSIAANAFKDDIKLSQVTMLAGVTSIGNNVFSYPGLLTIYGISGSYAQTYAYNNNIAFSALGNVPVSNISVYPPSMNLLKGDSKNIILSILPGNFTGNVTWEITSGQNIVSLADDGSGKITAKNVGTANVRITADSKTINVPITVLDENSASLILPENLTEINDYAFQGGIFIKVEMFDKVQRIGSMAFADCSYLKIVYIASTNVVIADDAFSGGNNLIIYGKSGSTVETFANTHGYTFRAY